MNKKMMARDDDVENVGIMQGLMDSMSDEDEDMDEEGPEEKMERRPDTPEILMNNLRGDMRSVDARRDELADLVGYQAATETPESVLAMLQPMLAKQGGIGALPQSGPLAQGPQAPMMGAMPDTAPPGMPPVPTDMGVPPPGMPPMPSDAGMPPPAQQGGIAELMAGMGGGAPASGQAPIAMAKGGYVQNFYEGSDEEGVTPAAEKPSEASMMFPPEMVAAAQRSSMNLFNQAPAKTPSIEEATAARLPMLNKLLGPDKRASEAQLLLDLGQRAFGFAANTDEAGRPLSGSFMSRFAGATRTLPAAMGRQLDQINQIDRQIKTLALQQGEKDIDKIAAQNSELSKRQGGLLNEVLRAQAKIEAKKAGGTKPVSAFGNSLDGRMLDAFVTLAPKVEAGTATPEEERILSAAKQHYTRPTLVPIMDPVTNMISGYREVRKELPTIAMSGGAPAAQAPSSGTGGEPVMAPSAQRPIGGGAERPTAQPSAAAPEGGEGGGGISLWSDRYKISGPVSAAKDLISGIPGLGDPFSEVTLARQKAKQQAERIVESLLKSTAGSVKEQEQLKGVIGIVPSAKLDPDAYGTKLIALGSTLRSMISEYENQGSEDSGLTPAAKGLARQRASALSQQYDNLGLPPVVMSQDEIRQYPPGTEVLWQGKQLYKVADRPRGNN